jgi:ABC-2 type transport system ATP-binding protein
MGDECVVRAEGLTKVFNGFVAVNGISFVVHRGEIFGLLGPNGSGKTTTIRMLLGLVPPTSGGATILGYQMPREAARLRPRVGYMSQRFSLYPDLTVMENLTFYGRAYGVWGQRLKERRQAIIRDMGLSGYEGHRADTLPTGIKQRLALGVAIIHQPDLLFLDEPTAGVDPISRRSFWDLLYHLAEEGKAIFVTTHYMDEAEQCHRLAFIHRGSLVIQGSPGQIRREAMPGQVLELDCEAPTAALGILRALPVCTDVTLYGTVLHITVSDAAQAEPIMRQALAAAGITVLNLSVIPPSLEDVFIASIR